MNRIERKEHSLWKRKQKEFLQESAQWFWQGRSTWLPLIPGIFLLITFEGKAPSAIGEEAFRNVTATVYYPADDPSWTPEVMKNYGGELTWVAY